MSSIIINDVEYKASDLTEEQVSLVNYLQVAKAELQHKSQVLAVLESGYKTLEYQLVSSLEASTDAETEATES
nr:hypothetical protein 6 [bacterium]